MTFELPKDRVLILDGAMGTMLQRYANSRYIVPDSFNILDSGAVESIHRQYINAGADVIVTNTFGSNRIRMNECNLDNKEVIKRGIEIARRASCGKYVAQDIGPIGKIVEPNGPIKAEVAYELFKEQFLIGKTEGVDLFLIETMYDINEFEIALYAAKEIGLPFMASMTFEEDGCTFLGFTIEEMIETAEKYKAIALGANCSTGSKDMIKIAEKILSISKTPVLVKPNAGLPQNIDCSSPYEICEKSFANDIKKMIDMGVKVVGGCCGTTPRYIEKIRKVV